MKKKFEDSLESYPQRAYEYYLEQYERCRSSMPLYRRLVQRLPESESAVTTLRRAEQTIKDFQDKYPQFKNDPPT